MTHLTHTSTHTHPPTLQKLIMKNIAFCFQLSLDFHALCDLDCTDDVDETLTFSCTYFMVSFWLYLLAAAFRVGVVMLHIRFAFRPDLFSRSSFSYILQFITRLLYSFFFITTLFNEARDVISGRTFGLLTRFDLPFLVLGHQASSFVFIIVEIPEFITHTKLLIFC
jgi:hypothetical protein